MQSMTVRCPKCRKKQEEPYPNRCGCGQSLLAALAARRSVAEDERTGPARPARSVGREASRLPASAATGQPSSADGCEPGENEW
jgi:hypothetical protein